MEFGTGWTCDHSEMTECCHGCGHFSCPCGVVWDENAEGPAPDLEIDINDSEAW